MWLIKLLTDFICGALDSLGGYHWLFCRRFIMPSVLAVCSSLVCGVWWIGILCLPACGTRCLGYFSGQNWGRALWLFTQAVALSIGLLLFHHLAWYFFVPYIVGAGIRGGIYKNWYQPVGDFITGFYLSLFIWGLHGLGRCYSNIFCGG